MKFLALRAQIFYQKNNIQIGWWTRRRFKQLKGDTFTITCNNNRYVELLAAFYLGDTTADYSFDIKAIKVVFSWRKFDENWLPM